MSTRPIYRIRIQPIDPILFGDNRLSRAGVNFTGTQDPSPLALYGAIGTFVRAAFHNWPQDLLGAQDNGDLMDPQISLLNAYVYAHPDGNAYFPVPFSMKINARRSMANTWIPSIDHVLSSLPQGFRPLVGKDPGKPYEGSLALSQKAIKTFLCGNSVAVPFQNEDTKELEEIYAQENRIGVGMDYGKNVALEGKLFNRPYRRYAEWVDFGGHRSVWGYESYWQPLRELTPKEMESLGSFCYLGGDRGRAVISLTSESSKPFTELFEAVLDASISSSGFLAYLLTPACFGNSLPKVGSRSPMGAAIGKPLYFSGWNNACNCPRPICVCAPAGSVFFYEWLPGDDRAALIEKYWLESISSSYASAGFGRILLGAWNANS